MRRTYSYNEAVKILGGKNHPVVEAMDKLLGGALLAGSLGLWEVLSLFDAKPDFLKLSNDLITKISPARREASRYSRTQQLHAAHAVVVMTAFFEAYAEQPVKLKLHGKNEDLVVGANPWSLELALPSAERPYEQNLLLFSSFYEDLSGSLFVILKSLAAWDGLNETEQERIRELLRHAVPKRALQRYEELLTQLAAEFPEVRFWCAVADGRATRKALGRLEDVLLESVTDRTPEIRMAELAGAYRGALRRTLVKATEVPEGVRIPSLAEAYVDPRFQVVADGARNKAPSLLSWWSTAPVREDLYAYLVGHLTSPQALSAPLLVLGDPGSGKSVLTEMMAARLPASDFAVVRVELRNTPADAGLEQQIEYGLRTLLQEQVSWAEFCRKAGGALPLVILDGFDELLQATGVSQTRYLTVIAEFQQRLEDMDRAAVFVVTSRLSVCAGLELPSGSRVVRLMPFDEGQVRAWLEVWNAVNRPLPAATVLDYPELASQPLLLLMLALYDAVDGSFQRDHLSMSRGQLYERLLILFAQREVTKGDPELSEADLARDVEVELERLSVVALAMFNRGTQWVAEHDVTADLRQLLGVESPERLTGVRTPLTAGETVLGRFFFVQKSEAVREDRTRLRTYEFLHATFGEYLVARFVWDRLTELRREDVARSRRKTTVDDTELYSALAYMALTTSKPVLEFLEERAATSDRAGLFDLVSRLFVQRDDTRASRGEYVPVSLPDSVRDAKYSLNLVLLALTVNAEFSGDALELTVPDWQRLTLFWKSRLSSGEWASVVMRLSVRPTDSGFEVTLGERENKYLPTTEPYMTLDSVSGTLAKVSKPLIDLHGVLVATALVKLMIAPADSWEPALLQLCRADDAGPTFWREFFTRLGVGGDDVALMRAFSDFNFDGIHEIEPQLEGLLRLHDLGVDGSTIEPGKFGLRSLLEFIPPDLARDFRPVLLRRAKRAAEELGAQLSW
ncbi:NACHT domain-containing protein [Lentzea sp. NPDC058450]|uniref:NACHT domain-containing protein n=1 Tax=Lentzea sp. NPDC058450 TaxID=3346505 RepID=UPI00364E77A6